MDRVALRERVVAAAKVELHVHLEGCISCEMVEQWHGREAAEELETALREYRRAPPRDFWNFVRLFRRLSSYVRSLDNLKELLRTVLESRERQNIVYSEFTITVSYLERVSGLRIEDQVEAIRGVLKEWNERGGSRGAVLLDIAEDTSLEDAKRIVACMGKHTGGEVVGLNVSTDEKKRGMLRFEKVLADASRSGVMSSIHLGEVCDAKECVGIVKRLKPRRIGHGLHLADDVEALAFLVEQHIAVELCLSSALMSAGIARYEEFPIRRFLDAGVSISINTDDPTIFGVTLVEEYERHVLAGLIDIEEIEVICAMSRAAAFA